MGVPKTVTQQSHSCNLNSGPSVPESSTLTTLLPNHPIKGWLGSRVVSMLDSGTEGPGFKSQSRRCRITVLGKLFTPILPLFTKQQNW